MKARCSSARQGQSLIIMILFLLAIVGLMAMILDLGFAFLSRRTMQTAVNTGSLEGARDIGSEGRQHARRVIRNVFDDDLDPNENRTTLGAGPNGSLVSYDENGRPRIGIGNGSCELFKNRHEYIYRPDPQLNEENAGHGDLVTGDYHDRDDCDHLESADYERNDFNADQSGESFLARIRRTPQRDSVANSLDRVAGTSSSGGGSPLLLGHLMPFIPSSESSPDIRRDGVTVRATSIADVKPIVYVGTAIDDEIYGAVAYGRYVDSDAFHELANRAISLGEVVSIVDSNVGESAVPTGYLPILVNHNGNDHVVGFTLHIRNGDRDDRKPNGSPRLHDAISTLNGLAPESRDVVLTRHRELANDPESGLARVPVLVNSIR